MPKWLSDLWSKLRVLWFKYTNTEHFFIGSLAIFISLLISLNLWYTFIVLLVGGIVHEWIDGDLRSSIQVVGELRHPYEGIKDVIWFLLPLAWYLYAH